MRHVSNALHERVTRFIDASLGKEPTESFDDLACDIARFQNRANKPVGRLWQALGVTEVSSAADIPAVPSDAFRLRRIAAHPPDDDTACFLTSGTTGDARGTHPMRITATYARSALAWGRHMLLSCDEPLSMVVLASPESLAPESSLTFMLARFADAIGGDTSWHFDGSKVDVAAVVARCRSASGPTLIAGTSFAFVHLIDAIGDASLPLPAGSRVMQTGGFKGRSRVIEPATLRQMLSATFAVPEARVVGEYGMTELSSQLYQGGLVGRDPDRYFPPPWLTVTPVDPETLAPCEGVGLARFVDLANVDSSVAIQTADRIERFKDGSIRLLGRAPGAPPRGCSLALEHLVRQPLDVP